MTKVATIGLEPAKNVFQVHGIDASGGRIHKNPDRIPADCAVVSAGASMGASVRCRS